MNLEGIRRCLARNGLRCTPQCYAVRAFVAGRSGHPTAAEILDAVNHRDPRTSRGTTYSNLRDFIQASLVREVPADGRAARFERKAEPSHHFICERRGRVDDFAWHDLPAPPAASLGERILRESETNLRGL